MQNQIIAADEPVSTWVHTRLQPAELQALKILARTEQRSMSNMLRLAVRTLIANQAQQNTPPLVTPPTQ